MDGRAALETVNYTRELAHALSVRLFSRPSYAFCLRSRSSRRRFPASRNAATDDHGACIRSHGRYEIFFDTLGGDVLFARAKKSRVCCTCNRLWNYGIDIGDSIYLVFEPCQVWFLSVVAEKCRWRSEQAIRLEMGTAYLLLNRIRVKLVVVANFVVNNKLLLLFF